jgi:hypothetical protein
MWRYGLVCLLICTNLHAAVDSPAIDEVFQDLYNFNFPAAHGTLNEYIDAHPQEPLPYAVRAAAYLFYELDRLGVLESEFLTDDNQIVEKKKPPQPDPKVRAQFLKAIDDTQKHAEAILKVDPNDRNALFAMCISQGVATDYMALVEKRQMSSLAPAKQSNTYAQRLLKIDPKFYDPYLTAGFSEYLVGSLPFFVRWFVHFDNVNGSKQQGKSNLELVANDGHYLKPFAKILLSIIALREKRPRDAQKLLVDLSHDYPSNPLFRKELTKINAKLVCCS